MSEKYETYYKLVNILRKHGVFESKRHGEYRWLVVIPGWDLKLDTWNGAIQVYNNGKYWQTIGSNWGGFYCNIFWIRYFLAHLGKYKI